MTCMHQGINSSNSSTNPRISTQRQQWNKSQPGIGSKPDASAYHIRLSLALSRCVLFHSPFTRCSITVFLIFISQYFTGQLNLFSAFIDPWVLLLDLIRTRVRLNKSSTKRQEGKRTNEVNRRRYRDIWMLMSSRACCDCACRWIDQS